MLRNSYQSVLSLIRDATSINVFDVNYLYGSEKFNILRLTHLLGLKRRSATRSTILFLKATATNIGRLALPSRERGAGGAVGCIGTQNQSNVIVPLLENLPEARLIVRGGVEMATTIRRDPFPTGAAYLLSLPFLPHIARAYWRADGYRHSSFRYGFREYWLCYGTYIVWRLILRRLRPSLVIVANDISFAYRSLALAARHERISSVYIQHASVTDDFPPLEFDYALLEGIDALDKYGSTTPTPCKIFVLGMVKARKRNLRRLTGSSGVLRVGVCTNMLDPLRRVETVCSHLRASKDRNLHVCLRPHPRTSSSDLVRLRHVCERNEMRVSDPAQEDFFEFASSIDVLVAGDSNVHLEAAMMDVYPLYYDFSGQNLDTYGFVHHGLVDKRVSCVQRLDEEIEALRVFRPSVRLRAARYCATIGTEYDGRSLEVAVDLLSQLMATREPVTRTARWEKGTDAYGREAYFLAGTFSRASA